MFTLSDDKTAYGTLKGLVEVLKSDALQAEHAMITYSERSSDYARAKGARGAYNLTIALIISTDVWTAGQQAEQTATKVHHMHTRSTTTDDTRILLNNEQLEAWLRENSPKGFRMDLWTALIQHGLSVVHCDKAECLASMPETPYNGY